MRKESILEYLSRGGVITRLPYIEPEPHHHIIPVTTHFRYNTLEDGEFYFSEEVLYPTISTPKDQKTILSKVDVSKLPAYLVEKLLNGDKSDEKEEK